MKKIDQHQVDTISTTKPMGNNMDNPKKLTAKMFKEISEKILKNHPDKKIVIVTEPHINGIDKYVVAYEQIKLKNGKYCHGNIIEEVLITITAVDWFWNQLSEILPYTVDTETGIKLHRLYQECKAMEWEQIYEAWEGGIKFTEEGGKSFEQVYGNPDNQNQ